MGIITTSFENKTSVSGGTLIIDDTNLHSGLTGVCIECVSDATVVSCDGFDAKGDALDFTGSAFNWNELKSGSFYYTKKDTYVHSVEISSGVLNIHQY